MDAMACKIIVERHTGALVQTEQYDAGLASGMVDGIGRGQPAGGQAYRRSASRWDGDSLVIEKERGVIRAAKKIPQLAEMESWSFDAQGKLVSARTVRIDDAAPATAVSVYRREK